MCDVDPESTTCGQWKLHVTYGLAKAQAIRDLAFCENNIHYCNQHPAEYDYVMYPGTGAAEGGCGGYMRAFGCQLPWWDPSQ